MCILHTQIQCEPADKKKFAKSFTCPANCTGVIPPSGPGSACPVWTLIEICEEENKGKAINEKAHSLLCI